MDDVVKLTQMQLPSNPNLQIIKKWDLVPQGTMGEIFNGEISGSRFEYIK